MMGEKNKYSFELNEEMLSRIEKEFAPQDIAKTMALAVKGKPASEIPEIGKKLFTEYGKQWAARVINLGESYSDRTYEVLRESIEETGSPVFPLIPQRFIEIAYLSTQRVPTISVMENNKSRLAYRIEACRTYQAVADQCGQEAAELLTCQEGCLQLCQGILDALKIDGIKAEMSARTPDDGYCEFSLKKTKT
jgi:hypothetical protein